MDRRPKRVKLIHKTRTHASTKFQRRGLYPNTPPHDHKLRKALFAAKHAFVMAQKLQGVAHGQNTPVVQINSTRLFVAKRHIHCVINFLRRYLLPKYTSLWAQIPKGVVGDRAQNTLAFEHKICKALLMAMSNRINDNV